MLYEIPFLGKDLSPAWGDGIGGIQAALPNGTVVNIPVLEATNVLTVGVVGTGKTKSYTLPAAKHLLASNPKGRNSKKPCATGILAKRKRSIVSDTFVSKLSTLFGAGMGI